MKTFLKLTVAALGAAMLMIAPALECHGQNWPQQTTIAIYTNFQATSVTSNTLTTANMFSSPYAYSTSASYTQLVTYTATVYPNNGSNSLSVPSSGAWGTNQYAVLSSNVYTNVTTVLPALNISAVTISNASTNALSYAWIAPGSQVASNSGTVNWPSLSAGGTVTFGGAQGFMPLGNFNALTVVGSGLATKTNPVSNTIISIYGN